jgi:hypothetical protein
LERVKIDWSVSDGLTVKQLTEDLYNATGGNLGLLRHFLTQIVVHLEKQKSGLITPQIMQKAYARLGVQ